MIKNLVMSAVRAVAPTLFNTGKGVLSDVLAGKNLKSSIIKRAGKEVLGKAATYVSGATGGPPINDERQLKVEDVPRKRNPLSSEHHESHTRGG